jgi:hypothetical protein
MKKTWLTALAMAGALAASGAQASSVHFDFRGDALDGSNQMTESGITVTAYAGQYDDNADFNLWNPGTWPTNQNEDAITTLDCSTSSSCSRTVADTSLGLGVGGRHDSAWIDGFNGNDLLTLRFSREVNFHDVVFAGWDSRYDSFDLFVDGVLVAPEERTGSGAFSLAGLTGTFISFGADAWDDAFKVESINIAPVPLPATALMLLAGLGGFAFFRRGMVVA